MQATKEMSIPCLPEAQRDQYTRQLQMTEGLLSVAASVARMSVDLLAEISKGDQSITAQISELERIIVKQTTLAQEWKAARDAAKAAEAAQKEGAPHSFARVPLNETSSALPDLSSPHANMASTTILPKSTHLRYFRADLSNSVSINGQPQILDLSMVHWDSADFRC